MIELDVMSIGSLKIPGGKIGGTKVILSFVQTEKERASYLVAVKLHHPLCGQVCDY